MPKLFLYNTLTRTKEEFKPIKKGQAGFYHCGPTVYWTQHIGNLRGMACGDIIVRALRYLGFKVKHVRNYTDVGHLVSDRDEGEDKMEKGAKREGKMPEEIAEKYIKIFERDAAELNLLEPDKKPKATDYVQEMIKMVNLLIKKGCAYSTDLAVYFDTTKAKNYGQLSGQELSEKITGAGRGEVKDKAKKNAADFALWFFKAGAHERALQSWPSPFKSRLAENGRGFPGWHIECSAMGKKLLGQTIDIHLGGIEHIPVHHTNEIAQSEAANGVKFVNYWLHNEHLLVDGEKMAKSQGTVYSLAEVKERGFVPLALRFFFLQAHYRSKENFTWGALEAAAAGLEHLYNQVRVLPSFPPKADQPRAEIRGGRGDLIKQFLIFNFKFSIKDINKEYKEKFVSALGDDFNTPQALAAVQELLKSQIPPKEKLATILDFDKVLGLGLKNISQGEKIKIPADINELIKARDQARRKKDWPEADRLRAQIEKLGWKVEDTERGERVSRK